MVQDPNFWRRFSVAVHQDDLTKEQAASRPGLKHSYVYPSNSTCPSAPLSPTSQCHLSPAFPASPVTSSLSILSASVSTPPPATLRREEVWQAEIEAEKAAERERAEAERERQVEKPTGNQAATVRRPSKLQKSASRASTRPLLRRQTRTSFSLAPNDEEKPPSHPRLPPRRPSFPSSLRRPSIPGFRSPSALSFSGRPRSAFKTWTTITANPHPRDSWLEGQQKKRRQRTWICWCFWLCVFALVAGVVVTVVVLRAHGII